MGLLGHPCAQDIGDDPVPERGIWTVAGRGSCRPRCLFVAQVGLRHRVG